MKTNRYFAIAVVVVLVLAAVWIVAEAGVKSTSKPNAEYPYLTPVDYENFRQIVKKSRPVLTGRNQIDILKGLGAIDVLVEELNPNVERLGLTKQALQTDVELLLRKYGIEIDKSNMFHCLYIQVNVLPSDSGFVAYNISVEFRDVVIPTRNPTIMIVGARVWKSGSVGYAGKEKVRSIRENVEDFVKEFINDYLAANPKEQSAKENNKPKTD